jgi:hypothetical protein
MKEEKVFIFFRPHCFFVLSGGRELVLGTTVTILFFSPDLANIMHSRLPSHELVI